MIRCFLVTMVLLSILQSYAEDPRGFCANYARRVLAERRK